jgi:hypothetical protein
MAGEVRDPSSDFYNSFEPKTTNRFIIDFGEPFDKIPKYVTKECTPLILRKSGVEYRYDDVVFTLYDPIQPSTSQIIRDAFDVLKTKEHNDFKINVELLGPVGDSVSQWILRGEIEHIDFGKLSWSGEKTEPLLIKITFKVHSAILNY